LVDRDPDEFRYRRPRRGQQRAQREPVDDCDDDHGDAIHNLRDGRDQERSHHGATARRQYTTNTALFNATTGATSGILGVSGAAYTAASILTLNITAATSGDLANMLTDVQTAISSITSAASTLGSMTTNLKTQQNYISNLSDSLTTGVGSLVDANMNEAATRLAALQVQQQLGVQALSISNSNTRLILKLFGL
jgi:flagellin-like hook-associated protein FlgL